MTVVCQNPGMSEEKFSRRSLFGRVLLVAGGTATLLTLAGCPGGDQGDDDDDDGGGEDDDD
jgi:hypothetical protein